MEKIQIEKIYPLSPMQEGMLFASYHGHNTEAYFEQVVLTVKGSLDIALLEKSFKMVIDRHDALRGIFLSRKLHRPVQVILKGRAYPVNYEDISGLALENALSCIQRFKQKERKKGFDLARGPLLRLSVFRIKNDEYQLTLSFNHIIMDGWCIGLIIQDFFTIYCSLQKKEEVVLETAYSYKNYINWLEKQDVYRAELYWKEYLSGYQTPAFPMGCKKMSHDYTRRELDFSIDEDLTKRISVFAREHLITVNTFFQTVWGILLQNYNNQNDVVFGSVVSGRPYQVAGVEKIVGLFINTIPVRIQTSEKTTALELLKEVQAAQISSLEYAYLPLPQIQNRSALQNQLINHILAFENYPLDKAVKDFSFTQGSGFEVISAEVEEDTVYDFNLVCWPENKMQIRIVYNGNIFPKHIMERIEGHLKEVVLCLLDDPTVLVNQIDLFSDLNNLRLTVACLEEEGDFSF